MSQKKTAAEALISPDTGRWRRWVLLSAVGIVSALILIAALEMGLRIAGTGFEPSLFIRNGSSQELTGNPRYTWRYFPAEIAPQAEVITFPGEKAEGTYRIFVLGGSAAKGDPRPGISFSRMLEAMLEDSFPEVRFELVSTAMTAISSHVVREVATECADQEPDLLLVYMGHNEVIGPYGAGTLFAPSNESLAAIRWSIRVDSTRVGQLLSRSAGNGGSSSGQPARWKGLEFFSGQPVSSDDPRLETMLSQLHSNLDAIVAAGSGAGAEVLVSTVGVNLADNPPFVSVHREGLESSSLTEWKGEFEKGREFYNVGEFEQAVAAFERALTIDGSHAELHYRLGRAQLVIGQNAQASESLQRAVDLDALRIRADSRINQQIRLFVSNHESGALELVDGAAALAAAPETVNGITGAEIFHDHAHLNARGNYRLAEAFFLPVAKRVAERFSLAAPGQTPSFDTVARRLALSPWDGFEAARQIVQRISRPPFTAQAGHSSSLAVRRGMLNELRGFASVNAQQTRQAFVEAVGEHPADLSLRERFAMLLESQGDSEKAAEEWEELVSRVGGATRWHTRWGFALLDQEKNDEALSRMRKALELAPESITSKNNLALVLQRRGDLAQARELLEEVVAQSPTSIEARLNLAKNFLLADEVDKATAEYERILEKHPGVAEAAFGLGLVLEARHEHPAAIEQYRKALELDPNFANAHNNIGYVLEKEGQLDQALAEYNAALKIDPYHATSLFNAADIFLRRGEIENAGRAYEAALRLVPSNIQARYNLAMVYQMAGAELPAAEQLGVVLQLRPNFIKALHDLAWILATTEDDQLRDPINAVAFATRAVQLSGGSDPRLFETLAAALASAGQREEARQALESGMRAARLQGNTKLETALRSRLLELEKGD